MGDGLEMDGNGAQVKGNERTCRDWKCRNGPDGLGSRWPAVSCGKWVTAPPTETRKLVGC